MSLSSVKQLEARRLDGCWSTTPRYSGGAAYCPSRDLGHALPEALKGAFELCDGLSDCPLVGQREAFMYIGTHLSMAYSACMLSVPDGIGGIAELMQWAQEDSVEIPRSTRQASLAMVALFTLQELFVLLFGGRSSALGATSSLDDCKQWAAMVSLLGLLPKELSSQVVREFNKLDVRPGDLPIGRILLRNGTIKETVEKFTKLNTPERTADGG